MFAVSVFLLLLVVIFFIFNKNNDIGKAMSVMLFSVVLIGITGTIYLSKTISYTYTFALDYRIYIFVSKLKIYLSTICRMFNMSICMFLLSSAMFLARQSRKILQGIVFLIPLALFMILNDPGFHREMELRHALGQNGFFADYIFTHSADISVVIMAVYILMPIVRYTVAIFKEKVSLSRKYSIIVLICMVFVDTFVVAGFFFGKLSNIMVTNMDIARLPKSIKGVNGYFASMLILLPVFVVIISLIWYYKPLMFLNPAKTKRIAEITKKTDSNLYSILHEIKNNIISVALQIKIAENSIKSGDYKEAEEELKTCYASAEKYLERLNEKLKFFADISGTIDVVNIVECVKNVASQKYGYIPELECTEDCINVLGNKTALCECFKNIIINAASSLDAAKRDKPSLKISIVKKERYCLIDFMDNGIGISKKEMRNIFRPFYSYIKSKNCSGIGLSYCKSVIEGHNGAITVKSKKDVYADFQIILPVYGEKKNLFSLKGSNNKIPERKECRL